MSDDEASEYIPKIPLGQIVADLKAASELKVAEILNAVSRHLVGDWGEVSNHQRKANEWAILQSRIVVSVYSSSANFKFLVRTDLKRKRTTISLL